MTDCVICGLMLSSAQENRGAETCELCNRLSTIIGEASVSIELTNDPNLQTDLARIIYVLRERLQHVA